MDLQLIQEAFNNRFWTALAISFPFFVLLMICVLLPLLTIVSKPKSKPSLFDNTNYTSEKVIYQVLWGIWVIFIIITIFAYSFYIQALHDLLSK